MSIEPEKLKQIVEAVLLAAARPLSLDQLQAVFKEEERPDKPALREALQALTADYHDRSIEIREVASGFRVQVRQSYAEWTSRLWEERPTRYSRALLETLALIAYRQPITRGEIEDVRGVSVSSNIVKTLMDRNWIRIVGHRDVPGRPAMFGTTREFLDYFGLKSLDELPTLAELRDIDSINVELDFDGPRQASAGPAAEYEDVAEWPDDDAESGGETAHAQQETLPEQAHGGEDTEDGGRPADDVYEKSPEQAADEDDKEPAAEREAAADESARR